MAITLAQRATIAALAKHLYGFLPASGNNATSFPLAARRAGVFDGWPQGLSKEPSIVALLSWTLERQKSRFCPLIQEVVVQSMSWSNRPAAMTRQDIQTLNALLLGLDFKIPELHHVAFLDTLGPVSVSPAKADSLSPDLLSEGKSAELSSKLLALASLEPQARGFAFEKFLVHLFEAFNLAPRASFRNTGEQIDGSFVLHNETYLLEAKWQRAQVDAESLRAFAGKVSDKATWARGLFISESGFSVSGLEAFGRRNSVICMDGLDMYEVLSRRLDLREVLAAKVRAAAETGRPFVRVRDLF